jgi:uncharacterized protein YjbJ (UPF0337 family)
MGFMDKVKGLLSQNAGTIDAAIDKAGDIVDEKTQGKYKDTVDKAQDAAKKAVDEQSGPKT